MTDLVQFVFSGLTAGAIYGLVALGFGIVFRGTGAVNFAQGEFVMLGGVGVAALHGAWSAPLLVDILLVLAGGAVVGVFAEVVVVRLSRSPSPATLTLATIGLALVVRAAVLLVTNRRSYSLPGFTGGDALHVGGAALQPQTLWNLGLVAVAGVALALLLRSRLGLDMRATADDRAVATAFGVSFHRATGLVFVVATVLACLAGVALAPVTSVSYDSGTLLGLKGFAAAMLGSLGSARGAIAGGFALGLTEALFAGYVSSTYADVVAFVLLLAVLLIRPTGLFRGVSVDRV